MVTCRLSDVAQDGIVGVLAGTRERHGEQVPLRDERLLVTALRDIASDPARIRSIGRPDFGRNVRSYHPRHSRDRARHADGIVRNARHFLLCRIMPGSPVVIRRMYDAMEVERYIPAGYGDA